MMRNPFKRKKRKFSDEVVARKWGKNPMTFFATDTVVKALSLYKVYESETGKHAIWGGKVTKQFLKWKEKNVVP